MKDVPFILGSQYYRPPFPKPKYWEDDIKAMRDAGLNTVQLWLLWGWCEPAPGRYVFDDYDRIADLAARQGMGIVLSTLPEINPFWVPRVHPDGLMRDIEGDVVPCCNRVEVLSGIVPGGCSDHPGIRKRMTEFLTRCAEHFGPRDNLLAWDCWNETRWCNAAPNLVCFCDHSLKSFREFLKKKYGDLDGLGDAWGRRYCNWEDVRVGRLLGNSYPEMHDFMNWLTWRARETARWRVRALRAGDPDHRISLHAAAPSIFGLRPNQRSGQEMLFGRGIDWDVAEEAEGYGFSSFVKAAFYAMCPEELCLRMSGCMTAGGDDRPVWMSELQGGPTAHSGRFGPSPTGDEQQMWIWTGISRGAKAAICWCWRPEVFGQEINGYGIIADDSLADSRIKGFQATAKVLDSHGDKVAGFTADPAQVGVLFQRDTYFYSWMAMNQFAEMPFAAVPRFCAYPKALERLNAPYEIYDDRHLPQDSGSLHLILVPWAAGLDDAAADWLVEFAKAGGTVFVEGAAGCQGADTYFRYPNDRPFYRKIGLAGDLHRAPTLDRRIIPPNAMGNVEPIEIPIADFEATCKTGQADVVALEPDGLPLLANVGVGKGRVICLGTVIGERMESENRAGFGALLRSLLGLAGVSPRVKISGSSDGFCSGRLGRAGNSRLLMVTNHGTAQEVTLEISRDVLPAGADIDEWFAHSLYATAHEGQHPCVAMKMAEYDHAVLEWPSA